MKKVKNIVVFILLIHFILQIAGIGAIEATNDNEQIKLEYKNVPYSDKYIEYILSHDEENGKNIIEPRKYDIANLDNHFEKNNPFLDLKKSETITERRFSLRDIIKDNMVIKNQKSTGSCWAFASTAAMESNLAISNYLNNNPEKKYDFSERHLMYGASNSFKNNEYNDTALNVDVAGGGSFSAGALNYYRMGNGAVNESDMPFENNEKIIDINEWKGKSVQTEIYDVLEIESKNTNEVTDADKLQLKEYIKIYGGIVAGIRGDSQNGDGIDIEKGTINWTDNSLGIDHEVLIVGWDDDFSKDNFKIKPKNNGAWIIKNSWGERREYTKEDLIRYFKAMIFMDENAKSFLEEKKVTRVDDITEEMILEYSKAPSMDSLIELNANYLELEYDEQNQKYVGKEIGDKGFMYISYEDVYVYQDLCVLQKATDEKKEGNIYTYSETGHNDAIQFNTNIVYLGNKYTKRENTKDEFINNVSLYTMFPAKYTVFVNPNSDSFSKDSLQQVKLKTGDNEILDAGYHSLEFAEDVKIKGNNFSIVVKIEKLNNNIIIPIESKINIQYLEEMKEKYNLSDEFIEQTYNRYKNIKVENNKSFFTNDVGFSMNNWTDLGKLESKNVGLCNSDSTITVYTNLKEKPILSSIEIVTPPNKVNYTEGENFDKTGLKVVAKYSDGTTETIDNYTIEDGTNLKSGQTFITITYGGKSVRQEITVNKKNETPEQPPQTNEKPIAFDVSKAKVSLTNVSGENGKIKVVIDNISRSNDNDKTEYWYLVSINPNEKIPNNNFVKIKEEQKNQNKLEFTIDSTDINNYDEILKNQNVYIYIEEVASRNGSQKVTYSNALLLKKSNSSTSNPNTPNSPKPSSTAVTTGQNTQQNKTSKSGSSSDSTIAKVKLPYAGYEKIIIGMIIILICAIYFYTRSKKLEREMNGK